MNKNGAFDLYKRKKTYIFVNFGDKEGPVLVIVVVALVGHVSSWRLLLILSIWSFVYVIGDSYTRIGVSIVQIQRRLRCLFRFKVNVRDARQVVQHG